MWSHSQRNGGKTLNNNIDSLVREMMNIKTSYIYIFDHREINVEKIITVKYETYTVAEWKPAPSWLATILDKTVEKMSHSQSISLNMVAIPIPPSPLPLEEMLLCVLKQPWSLDVCRKQLWPGARGIWYRKSVVVEIVLLRTILCMKG